MSLIKDKLKEMFIAVIPITFIVLLINIFFVPIETNVMIRFFVGSILIIIGLTIFLMGVDIGITPFGSKTGNTLVKSNKLWIVAISGIVLGFLISIAEPGLLVLANQVEVVTNAIITASTLFIIVSVGLSIMISIGFIRIFYNLELRKILLGLYLVIFALSFFVSEEFLGLAFDASGATTGILAVPFILSLSTGISKLKKNSIAGETDSFGLVAIASSGAIIAVMLLDIFTPQMGEMSNLMLDTTVSNGIFQPFLNLVGSSILETLKSLGPLLLTYLVLNFIFFKLKKRENRAIIAGFIMIFIGLFIFLLGVNGGFMEVGVILGEKLVNIDNKIWFALIGFIIGVVTIIAEPAVYVLTKQIDEVTSGYVNKKAVYTTLGIGVGFAIGLSSIRIIFPEIKLWYILLPGYILSLSLTFFTPKLFVGIAFDAGGVATGPITATFILAFIQGAANATNNASLLTEGFGMISLVAMTPIIALQILGLVFKFKLKKMRESNYE